jgi:hypothetical protein
VKIIRSPVYRKLFRVLILIVSLDFTIFITAKALRLGIRIILALNTVSFRLQIEKPVDIVIIDEKAACAQCAEKPCFNLRPVCHSQPIRILEVCKYGKS